MKYFNQKRITELLNKIAWAVLVIMLACIAAKITDYIL